MSEGGYGEDTFQGLWWGGLGVGLMVGGCGGGGGGGGGEGCLVWGVGGGGGGAGGCAGVVWWGGGRSFSTLHFGPGSGDFYAWKGKSFHLSSNWIPPSGEEFREARHASKTGLATRRKKAGVLEKKKV